ncbi:MAG TPA: alpha-amylase family glycosyl hydrolase, partial [Bacteroidales bacterium]|nr:alpha-amylase family glycosyl hydrolase [Bacteroidales bacterium]
MKQFYMMILLLAILGASCKPGPRELNKGPVEHPDWSRTATIYEVNIRQYTPQGTFVALERELPRLQKMGIDILWLMPIHPIGDKNRKGSLGSYYSVRDYFGVNPEYGTMKDFKELVNKAHNLGMKVIIDWVANHTSWDNEMLTDHPDWYKKDSTGKVIPPVADWTDAAALDYTQEGLRKYMIKALEFWIREADIDGYRCDVAGMLPVDFWNQAIPDLKKIKPVFMLAEEETPLIHDTGLFDASYSWQLFRMMNQIAKGTQSADKIDSLFAAEKKVYNADAYRMRFTSNHDENSWNGTEFERLGDGAQAFAVLTFTCPGMPLIYSGQEAAMNKRLRFFEKDTIPWGNFALESFYSRLTSLKKKDSRLFSAGKEGGDFLKVPTSNDRQVYAFLRKNDSGKVFVLLNLSPEAVTVQLTGNAYSGRYRELFSGIEREWKAGATVELLPWEYQ